MDAAGCQKRRRQTFPLNKAPPFPSFCPLERALQFYLTVLHFLSFQARRKKGTFFLLSCKNHYKFELSPPFLPVFLSLSTLWINLSERMKAAKGTKVKKVKESRKILLQFNSPLKVLSVKQGRNWKSSSRPSLFLYISAKDSSKSNLHFQPKVNFWHC